MSGQRLLQLDALLAGYNRPVGQPLDLRLARGEVIGLWGPNGAGKSTVLKALVGEAQCHAGSFSLASGAQIAYLAQRQVRPPELPLTGREMLRFLGVDREHLPAGLADCLDRRVDALSGGQYQLLCLWATLAGGADVVLLDEPTNHLDPRRIDLAADEIRQRRSVVGCLVVSHDRAFLEAIEARVVEIRGRDHG